MKGAFNPAGPSTAFMLVLSGLDGSGKSTQTALLADRLRGEGVRARAVWNRCNPTVTAPFIHVARKYLRAKEGVEESDYRNFTEAKETKNEERLETRPLAAHGLERIRTAGSRETPSSSNHGRQGNMRPLRVRHTLIDIAINFSVAPEDLRELMNHPLLALFPRPGFVIFIDVDPEVGAARKGDGTPAAYLADRRAYYTAMARILNAPLVDGAAPVESVSKAIWELTKDWRMRLGIVPAREHDQGKNI